jgi:Cys-rich repeat protein
MPDTDAGSSASSSVEAISPLTRDDGAAPLPDARRYSAFDLACTRDSQCGPGKCITGECFYGCESDAQCGSGDRCAAETGTRICLPDLNQPVQCTRSAQCGPGALCLNGSCRQSCYQTEECSNLLDRCADGICQPDRRPLGVCVLNQECPAGFVCLDGSCVDGCSSSPDGARRVRAMCAAPSKMELQVDRFEVEGGGGGRDPGPGPSQAL